MLKSILLTMSLMIVVGVAGCTENKPPANSAATGNAKCHAECLVCKYNADLACIDVELEKETPSYTYEGKTYYFCSPTCAKKFQANPAKYVNQK